MTTTAKSTIDDLSFEQAMAELESIVRGLESGDIELEANGTIKAESAEIE